MEKKEKFEMGTDPKCAYSENDYCDSTGDCSHAEGCYTAASGKFSHAEGHNIIASGDISHAEGFETTASGNVSHAEGGYTTASGVNSHAEGAATTAIGQTSHAEGYLTTASGMYSHAEGWGTQTNNVGEHACGRFNRSKKSSLPSRQTVFSVGIGAKDIDKPLRMNAIEAKANGDVYIDGIGDYNKGDKSESLQKVILNLIKEVKSLRNDVDKLMNQK